MNCLNCGAPTSPVTGRSYFVCTYCESHRELSAAEATEDLVVTSQEQSEHTCPQCLHELLLRASLNGEPVLHCPGCRGVLMSTARFQEVLQRQRQSYEGPEDRPLPLNPEELDRQTQCPQCRTTMEVHPYHGPGNAVIDTCFSCRLIWLDRGEFAALRRAPGRR